MPQSEEPRVYGVYIAEEELLKRLKRDRLTDQPRQRGWWKIRHYGVRVWIVHTGQADEDGTPLVVHYSYDRSGRIGRSWVSVRMDSNTLHLEEV